MQETEFLDTKAAAAFCGVSPETLATKRTRGGGPPFHRASGTRLVRYRRDELVRWMGEPMRSTSDVPGEGARA